MNTHPDKVLPVLRLLETTDLSERRIAELVDVVPTTVARYRTIQQQGGYALQYLETLSPRELRRRFDQVRRWQVSRPVPHWPDMHRRILRANGSPIAVWSEENAQYPEGYSYPKFVSHYNAWKNRLNILGRQQQPAGSVAYVGIAESTIPWIDNDTEQQHAATLFFGALGCSNYSFVRATPEPSISELLNLHIEMFNMFGGVPVFLQSCIIDGHSIGTGRNFVFNAAYEDLARHCRTHIVPPRLRDPACKPEMPASIRVVYRWICTHLRRRQFFSIDEINQAIQPLLMQLNQKPFKRLPGCRASWLHDIDKPQLRSLPETPFRIGAQSCTEPSTETDRTQQQFETWARTVGPNVSAITRWLFERHPGSKASNACDALMGFAHRYGDNLLDAACRRAREIDKPTVKMVRMLIGKLAEAQKIQRPAYAKDHPHLYQSKTSYSQGDHHDH